MGSRCSFCGDPSKTGGTATYPIPRSKYGKSSGSKTQRHHL